jgi:hypothetical protein
MLGDPQDEGLVRLGKYKLSFSGLRSSKVTTLTSPAARTTYIISFPEYVNKPRESLQLSGKVGENLMKINYKILDSLPSLGRL